MHRYVDSGSLPRIYGNPSRFQQLSRTRCMGATISTSFWWSGWDTTARQQLGKPASHFGASIVAQTLFSSTSNPIQPATPSATNQFPNPCHTQPNPKPNPKHNQIGSQFQLHHNPIILQAQLSAAEVLRTCSCPLRNHLVCWTKKWKQATKQLQQWQQSHTVRNGVWQSSRSIRLSIRSWPVMKPDNGRQR